MFAVSIVSCQHFQLGQDHSILSWGRTPASRVKPKVDVEPRLTDTGRKHGCTEAEAEGSDGNDCAYFEVVGGKFCHNDEVSVRRDTALIECAEQSRQLRGRYSKVFSRGRCWLCSARAYLVGKVRRGVWVVYPVGTCTNPVFSQDKVSFSSPQKGAWGGIGYQRRKYGAARGMWRDS